MIKREEMKPSSPNLILVVIDRSKDGSPRRLTTSCIGTMVRKLRSCPVLFIVKDTSNDEFHLAECSHGGKIRQAFMSAEYCRTCS